MVTVTVEQGKLRGAEALSENGRKFYEFLSVPYARPPVGELRFKSPQPPESWDGERDATTSVLENTACQLNASTGQVSGSEDCLYLNVYTPKLPFTGSEQLPVMFYIHGGGFIYGNGIMKEEASPEFLLDNNVVVVTINYRLGVLGFLSLDIPEASGNMGLKDQVKALEWVQKNIVKFSGDKDNVTIFGISAGSASVEYLMLAPTSKGLFHKAILQSGSTINDWAINTKYEQLVLNLAEKLEYQGNKQDKRDLYDFFLKVPVEELMFASFFVTETFSNKSIFFGFVPIIEKASEGAFLTTSPYKMLKEGNFVKIPVMRGFCEMEGMLMIMMNPNAVKKLIEGSNCMDFWSYELGNNDTQHIETKIRNVYLAQPEDDPDKFAVDFFGDLHFSAGVWLASIFFAKHGIPEYVYKFSYDGKLNFLKDMFGLKMKGASHGDDSGYIFKSSLIKAKPENTDILFRSKITQMWTNFAKTGNPTPCGNPDNSIQWPKFTEDSKIILKLDKEIKTEVDYVPNKMAIFEEIYEKI